MYCKNCGTKLSDTARFCPACGTQCSARAAAGTGAQAPSSAGDRVDAPSASASPSASAGKAAAKPASARRRPKRAAARGGETRKKRRLPGCLGCIFRLVVSVCIGLAAGLCLHLFVIQPYQVPTGSMEPTVNAGDYIFSEKVTYYSRDPQAGDIVTFKVYEGRETGTVYTSEEEADASGEKCDSQVYVKRVIATGGQTVDIEGGVVYVDGEALDEEYALGVTAMLAGSEVSFPYTVPEGELWLMGDNRESSQDSRWFGSVPVENVTGRVVLCYWPFEDFGFVE